MWAMLCCAVLQASAGPPKEEARFLFELAGHPVGVVELSRQRDDYRYLSRHFFTRSDGRAVRQQRARFAIDLALRDRKTGLRLETLYLWRKPKPGCVQVRPELGEGNGELCVESVKAEQVTGKLKGQPFSARYSEKGELLELTLGDARFLRASAEELVDAPALFSDGFAIHGEGRQAALEPALNVTSEKVALTPADPARIEQWAVTVRTALLKDSVEGECLTRARLLVAEAQKHGVQAAIVYGLLLDGDRAMPHAWVKFALPDGALRAVDAVLPLTPKKETHLGFPDGASAGELYLDLLAGRRKVVRS